MATWMDANGLVLLSDAGRSMNLTRHAYAILLDGAQAKLLDDRDKDPLAHSIALLVAAVMAIFATYIALRLQRAVLAYVVYIIVLGVLCFITGSDPFAPLAVLAAISLVAVLARSEAHLTHVLLLPLAAGLRAFSTYCLDGLHTSATTLLDVVADAIGLDMRVLLVAFALGSVGVYCCNGRFAPWIKSVFVFVSLTAVLSAWLSVIYALGLACLLSWLQKFGWALLALILFVEFAFAAMPATPVVMLLRDVAPVASKLEVLLKRLAVAKKNGFEIDDGLVCVSCATLHSMTATICDVCDDELPDDQEKLRILLLRIEQASTSSAKSLSCLAMALNVLNCV
ncbi:hypothetical protein SDRG_11773 [Saprolegnia diclina VS20]|uniref:Uncharacterized protein n=1 Tax=Saprolegnia diclina (strain VS20) TaxID=1156394 RepID=T0RDX8_SAPDV|nr:hypothetical protein SDRG_11773 [Saprolegnia diclina VS20]EQC30453.1 hypothetical protein SDRG_11773 [Saprolegnia diclina VS20]|eukprot:XP_008616046.1 hypothetical protein SDRG_11773 [Saprolegnia diclina VS20]